MAIAADSRDRVAEPPPADEAWTVGAPLGAVAGVAAVALVFAAPLVVLVVLALACVAITVASPRGLPIARLTGALTGARDALAPMARALATWAQGLSSWAQGLSLPAPREPASEPVPDSSEPVPAPSVDQPPVVAVAVADPPTVEMPAVVQVAVAAAPAAPPAVTPAGVSGPSTEELVIAARQLESAGDVTGAEHALARAAAAGHRPAAMHLGELHQRSGQASAAVDAYRQAADGDDSLASAAALSLGVLLEARGDVEGAEAAYRQAAAGDASASRSAAMLLNWLTRRREHEAA